MPLLPTAVYRTSPEAAFTMHTGLLLLGACGCTSLTDWEPPPDSPEPPTANVTAVRVTGEAGAYTFYVTIASDDTGCELYADWWEVLTPEGALVYRRILTHSHPTEQPFERSGGPVAVDVDDPLVVRGHLHPTGYAGAAVAGSAGAGFAPTTLQAGFAAELDSTPPLPTSCLF